MSDSRKSLDEALANQFKTGDIPAEALESLMGRIKLWICGCYPTLRHGTVAEDLAKDTVVRAYRSIGTYKGEAAFFSWILAIAQRVVATYFEKSGKELLLVPESLDASEPVEDPEALMILQMVITEVLQKLSETEREAHHLHISVGLSHEEVAKRLNLPSANAAQQATKRASEKIGRYLRENGYLLPKTACPQTSRRK